MTNLGPVPRKPLEAPKELPKNAEKLLRELRSLPTPEEAARRRGALIIRLHDEFGLTFGELSLLLNEPRGNISKVYYREKK